MAAVGALLCSAAAGGGESLVGYYSWNWGSGSTISGADFGVAFTGYTNVEDAINGYATGAAWCCPALVGAPYLSLGGGNSAGIFDITSLQTIANSMSLVKEANYSGVMFDAEIVSGDYTETIPAFAAAFKAAKSAGLGVMVTVSHSAPYHTDTPQDGVELIKAWVQDENIDVISPQLYSSGTETSPDFDETYNCRSAGCTWDLYRGSVPKFVPSLVDSSHLSTVHHFFDGAIQVDGYIQWAQTGSARQAVHWASQARVKAEQRARRDL